MELSNFLSMIWPAAGPYFIVDIRPDGRVIHYAVTNAFDGEARAEDLNTRGGNVYFAMASYSEKSYVDNKGKTRYRTQENVARLKCLWVDLDSKGKGDDYATPEDAIADIGRFCSETGVPAPTLIVKSGYGVHGYWVLDSELPRDSWIALAARWRATLDKHGILHDSSCTEDCARVLRPILTTNRKEGREDRTVELVAQNPVMSFDDVNDCLEDAAPMNFPKSNVAVEGFELNMMAETVVEYPPSSFLQVVKNCSLVREVTRLKGNVSEPLWYATLGLVKHTVEADKAIVAVSCGHPGYSLEGTKAKAEQWQFGPPTCAKLESVAAGLDGTCASCPNKGTVKSPIMLGHTHMQATEVVKVEVAGIITEKIEEIPAMPQSMQGFRWDGLHLQKAVMDDEATKKSGKDTFEWVTFCAFYFYPFCYYRNEEDELVMVWKLRERKGEWREFELTGEAMGTGGLSLFKELGAQGVIAAHGKKPFMEAYITSWYTAVKKDTSGSETYMHFGWHGDSFLLGTDMITPTGIEEVRVGGDAARMVKHFEPKGTTARWAELIDRVYNRPGHESYQFLLGAGFGSPLISLLGFTGGLSISAISTGTGLGKTTAEQMAMGIYGDGNMGHDSSLVVSTQQATPKYVFALAGLLHNLPVVVDEITNIKAQDASETLYAFSGGAPRMGLKTSGRMNRTRFGWTSMLLTSSNKSLVNIVSAFKPGATAEVARLVEYTFDRPVTLTKDEADDLFRELFQNYGHAGREYMTYVVQNRAKVVDMLNKLQKKVDAKCGFKKQDRFWSVGITATIGGLFIAKQLKLVKFDMEAMLDWVAVKVNSMRAEIQTNTADASELLGRMLVDISHGIMVTDTMFGKGNSGSAYISRESRGQLVGRAITDEGKVFITQSAISKWAADNHVSLTEMVDAGMERGWILDKEPSRIYLGRGTPITTGQTRCYVFNWKKLENCAADGDAMLNNVVSLMTRSTNS